jgi:hypothetical protein
MRLIFSVILAATAVVATSDQRQSAAPAQTADTPPATVKASWEWTVDERLAARFDPAVLAARRERLRTRRATADVPPNMPSGASADAIAAPSDSIYGTDNPELLLPFEIFKSFTKHTFVYVDDVSHEFRQDATRKALALGLPPDIVEVIEREAQELVALQRREAELNDQMAGPAPDAAVAAALQATRAAQCPVRAAAMQRLRAKYGASRFDRFLYTAIAPNVFYEFRLTENPAQLKAQEAGCQ